MKKILIPIVSAFLCFSLIGCATAKKALDAVAQNPQVVEPAVALVAGYFFSKAIDTADLQVKAEQINKVADKILATKFSSKPTKEEFELLITENVPGVFGAPLASALSGYYVKYTQGIDSADVESSVAVIKSIAGALKIAAAKYL